MKQTVRSKWLTLSVFVAFVVVSVFGFVWIYTGTHAASSSAPLTYIQYADPYGFYQNVAKYPWL